MTSCCATFNSRLARFRGKTKLNLLFAFDASILGRLFTEFPHSNRRQTKRWLCAKSLLTDIMFHWNEPWKCALNAVNVLDSFLLEYQQFSLSILPRLLTLKAETSSWVRWKLCSSFLFQTISSCNAIVKSNVSQTCFPKKIKIQKIATGKLYYINMFIFRLVTVAYHKQNSCSNNFMLRGKNLTETQVNKNENK